MKICHDKAAKIIVISRPTEVWSSLDGRKVGGTERVQFDLSEAETLHKWLAHNLPPIINDAKEERRKVLKEEHDRLYQRLEAIEAELGEPR